MITRAFFRYLVALCLVALCLVALCLVAMCLAMAVAQAAGPLPWGDAPLPKAAYARADAIAALGRELFFDPSLSASGKMSCASCHDPAHGFSAPDAEPVRMGGPLLDRPGTRAVPGLTYGAFTPPFTEHSRESADDGDESIDQGPAGGLNWDGRADRANDQVKGPLLSASEMANASVGAVVTAVAQGPHAGTLRGLYGADIFGIPDRAFAAIAQALSYFLQTPSVFSPFSSKYDAYLRGVATLTDAEARGLAIFNDPGRGGCAACHRSGVSASGSPPLFTDFGYVALGLPRNRAIPANADPGYFDLGLCERFPGRREYCGMFKAPGLRNAALKLSFYHNGAVHTLRDAVAFYAERDSQPARWYPAGKFDDLPPDMAENVSVEPPFGPQAVLSGADVDDLVAFLNTLTDGYSPR